MPQICIYINPCDDLVDTTISSAGIDEIIVHFDGVNKSYQVDGLTPTIMIPKGSLNENYNHYITLMNGGVVVENHWLLTKLMMT